MRNHGSAATRLFLILTIFPESRFARPARSREVSKSDPSPLSPIPISGPEEILKRFHCARLALISGRYALFPETY